MLAVQATNDVRAVLASARGAVIGVQNKPVRAVQAAHHPIGRADWVNALAVGDRVDHDAAGTGVGSGVARAGKVPLPIDVRVVGADRLEDLGAGGRITEEGLPADGDLDGSDRDIRDGGRADDRGSNDRAFGERGDDVLGPVLSLQLDVYRVNDALLVLV